LRILADLETKLPAV